MGEQSKIQWTDATWNPVRGCTKVSPGCAHCYAEAFAERFRGVPNHPYEQGFDLRLVPEKLDEPLRWKTPRRIFVNSMSDLFHDGVPEEYIGRVWSRMLECPQHTFQVLTKRSKRMREVVTRLVEEGARKGLRKPSNIIGMVSAEDQQRWDERVHDLLATPLCVRGVSVEPMLGPINFEGGGAFWGEPMPMDHHDFEGNFIGTEFVNAMRSEVDWIIFGGESGPKARPCNVDWIRDGVRQCREAGVAAFVKQLGQVACMQFAKWKDADPTPMITSRGNTSQLEATGLVRLALRDRKGGDPSEWPEDLRIREWPKGGAQ